MNSDPQAAGGNLRIQVAPDWSDTLLMALLVLNLLMMGWVLALTLSRTGRLSRNSFLARIAWRRAMPLLLVSVLALLFMWRIRAILPPFLIAFFLASLLDPVVTRYEKHGVSRGRVVGSMVALTFLAVVGIIVVTANYAYPQMRQLAENAQKYTDTLNKQADMLYENFKGPLYNIGIKENPLKDTSRLKTAVLGILESLKDFLIGISGQILWFIIIPLSLLYFLLEYQVIRAKLISFVPGRYRNNVDVMSQEIVDIFSAYVRGLAKVCFFYGLAASALFWLFGVEYAVFLGMATGILYAVPILGPLVAVASVAIVVLTMGKSVAFAILVVVLLVALQFFFDYVITPRVVGRSVGLHPLVNIFALMAGAALFGVWGMLLAVPVAASIQMLLVYFFPKLAEKPVLPSSAPAGTAPTPDEVVTWEEEAETQPTN